MIYNDKLIQHTNNLLSHCLIMQIYTVKMGSIKWQDKTMAHITILGSPDTCNFRK
ncbi:hypothetical protein XSR1_190029 [Xenorhabdus szentirmaii DSM 16338]|uniref:Uncharacterized protein n=1 Tax=Xenorhabdus szentirmaii DSM 16338 TaxID=1427518 RepID=W1IUH5_9GAMM|nr:hypothetical protein XSR1_190029 [Xenorhabdus szentirmaii DSM 16338]